MELERGKDQIFLWLMTFSVTQYQYYYTLLGNKHFSNIIFVSLIIKKDRRGVATWTPSNNIDVGLGFFDLIRPRMRKLKEKYETFKIIYLLILLLKKKLWKLYIYSFQCIYINFTILYLTKHNLISSHGGSKKNILLVQSC